VAEALQALVLIGSARETGNRSMILKVLTLATGLLVAIGLAKFFVHVETTTVHDPRVAVMPEIPLHDSDARETAAGLPALIPPAANEIPLSAPPKLDPKAREAIEREYRANLRENRLRETGLSVSAVLGLVAVAFTVARIRGAKR
jgi:hypothetical protein